MNKITILGSGTSTGVPILGCNCKVCQSKDPRNQRFRTSALLQTESGKNILIDASPDLRAQLLKANPSHLDAVLITHDHADHTHGMDDLRPYTFNRTIPLVVFAEENVTHHLKQKFSYIFDRKAVFSNRPILGGGIPLLDLAPIEAGKNQLAGEEFLLHPLPHGYEKTFCFRHHKMAYVTDCREIPENVLKDFHDAKLEVLIIDCLRYLPHQTHLHLDLTLTYIQAIDPKFSVLIHMGHEMEYVDLTHQLRERGIKNVFPAYDGQCFYYSKS